MMDEKNGGISKVDPESPTPLRGCTIKLKCRKKINIFLILRIYYINIQKKIKFK